MKILRSVVALVMMASFFAVPVWADGGKCSKSGGSCKQGSGCGQQKGYDCPVIGKFMEKAHFFLMNKDEVALTDDQVARIKELKLAVKKIHVQQEANMKLMFLDLDAKMSEPKVDVNGINAMLDQGSAGMAASTKEVIQAYADLKSVPTQEQMEKLKTIWWGKKK